MKKILALLLAVIMCFAMVAACDDGTEPPAPPPPPGEDGGSGGSGSSGGDDGQVERTEDGLRRQAIAEQYGLPYDIVMDTWEPLTLTYFDRNAGQPPIEDNPIIKIVEDITNIKIEYQMNAGDIKTAMGTMLTAGEVADICFFGGEAGRAIESNLFMPIEDLIEEYAPRLREHYDPFWNLMKYSDGHIYTAEIWGTPVGEQSINWANGSAMWMQKAVLEYFEHPPADLDEYFDMLREYAEVFPEIDGVKTIPFALRNTKGNGNFALMNAGYFMGGNANWGGAVNTDGNYIGAEISPDVHGRYTGDFNYRWWKKLNEEFHRGTFTQEAFTIDDDQYYAQLASGAALGFHDQEWNTGGAVGTLEAEGKNERTWLPIGLTYDDIEPNYLDGRQFTGSNGLNIANTNPDPIRTIQFMNWLIAEEVQRFLYWGIEGEHYFYDEDGNIIRPQEQRDLQGDVRYGYDQMGRWLLNAFPKMQGTYPSDNQPTDTAGSSIEYFEGLSEYDKQLFSKLGISTMTGFWGAPGNRPGYYPYWSITQNVPAGSDADLVNQQLEEVNDTIALMIVADPDDFDTMYQEYVDAILAIDVQPLVDFITEGAKARVG